MLLNKLKIACAFILLFCVILTCIVTEFALVTFSYILVLIKEFPKLVHKTLDKYLK